MSKVLEIAKSDGRAVWNVGLSALSGLPVGLLLSDSLVVLVLVCALAAVTTAVSANSLTFWISPVFSLSAIALLACLIEVIKGDFLLSATVFRVLFIGLWIACTLGIRRYRGLLECTGEAQVIATVAVLAAAMITYIQWDPISGFRTITQFGEDNGSWLNNVALSRQQNAAFSPGVGVSGGDLLGAVITGAVSFLDSSSWLPSNFDPTGLILLRVYGWGLLVLVVFGVAIFLRLSISINRAARHIATFLTALLTMVFGLNFLQGGYLTALLAAVWVSASTLIAILLSTCQEGKPIFLLLVLLLPTVMVGEMWFPLHYWTGIVVAVTVLGPGNGWLVTKVGQVRRERASQNKRPWLFSIALLPLIAIPILVLTALSRVSNGFDWTSIVVLIHTGGGSGLSTLQILILLSATVTVLQMSSRMYIPLVVLTVATSVASASVLMLARLTPPNEIGYGPAKFVSILTLSMIPLGCSSLAKLLASFRGVRTTTTSYLVVGALLTSLIQFGLPIQNLEVIWKQRSEPYWFEAVVAARTRFPDRIPLCLDTTKGFGRSERAYECSRLTIGLVGGERSLIAPQLAAFQWGNICTVEPDDAYRLWDDEFFSEIVIIVSDPQRLSSEAECQSRELTASDVSPFGKDSGYDLWPIGWLSSVRWDLVKLIDTDGRELEPSFGYLIDDPLDSPRMDEVELLMRYQSAVTSS